MVKVPSKHGLERKFKPWRRGKSEKSNKRSSLKQQLRGVERLLKKLPPDQTARRQELETKIESLQQEISEKQKVIQEKKHAEKAHGQRFLDRQRLARQEKQARKHLSGAKLEEALRRIALDQIYVAHHPNDVKYMPLFRKGERVVDTSRQLFRRAVTRRRILNKVASHSKDMNCSWIATNQYMRLPKTWAIQDEERVFGGTISRKGRKSLENKLEATRKDSRFAVASQHDAVLQAADKVEAELDDNNDEEEQEEEEDVPEIGDSDTSDSDGDGDDQPDAAGTFKTSSLSMSDHDSDSETSDSESDSEDETDPIKRTLQARSPESDEKKFEKQPIGLSNEDESSDEDSDEDNKKQISKDKNLGMELHRGKRAGENNDEDEDDGDDFFVDTDNEKDNVFSMTLKQVPALGDSRGDKSKGWGTQRQRPGQFKKRRLRI